MPKANIMEVTEEMLKFAQHDVEYYTDEILKAQTKLANAQFIVNSYNRQKK